MIPTRRSVCLCLSVHYLHSEGVMPTRYTYRIPPVHSYTPTCFQTQHAPGDTNPCQAGAQVEHRTGMRLTPSILVRLTRVLVLSGRTFFMLRGREDWSGSHVRVGARMSGAGQDARRVPKSARAGRCRVMPRYDSREVV